MKVLLLYPDRALPEDAPDFLSSDLCTDLNMKCVIDAMADEGKDTWVRSSMTTVFSSPLIDLDQIMYRQEALVDVLASPGPARELYSIACDTISKAESKRGLFSEEIVSSRFDSSLSRLEIFLQGFRKIRSIIPKMGQFASRAFRSFCDEVEEVLTDSQLKRGEDLIRRLKENPNLSVAVRLGENLVGTDYTLTLADTRIKLRERFRGSFSKQKDANFSENDLMERRDRAITQTTAILAQASDVLLAFYREMARELAFYDGCVRLRDIFKEKGIVFCMPELLSEESYSRTVEGLLDLSLVLLRKDDQDGVSGIISNSLSASGIHMYLITGANQGGKSTFLRSVGQAQLMAQCGMFTVSSMFAAPIREGIFSHFRRREDVTMQSGKLDEELERMDLLANSLRSHSLVLFNESFASTNEREGTEIFRGITEALLAEDVEIFNVCHMVTYFGIYENRQGIMCLRAEHLPGGKRTFRVIPGHPLSTAYGGELWDEIMMSR